MGVPALTAVFVEDNSAPAAVEYIAASHGATGSGGYAALMEALFSAAGSYRYHNQQASTRTGFDRRSPRHTVASNLPEWERLLRRARACNATALDAASLV